jgi:ArsR family transcriptional regulator
MTFGTNLQDKLRYNTFTMTNISAMEETASLFQALGQPTRLQILLALGVGEACVCHLEATFGWRQAYLSQHLMALRKAGIVTSNRVGRNIHYRLNNPELLGLIRQAALLMGQSLPEPCASADCNCPDCTSRREACSPASLYK